MTTVYTITMRRAVVVVLVLAGCPPDRPDPPPPPQGFRAVEFVAEFARGTATAGWQLEGDQGVDSNWARWMAMGKGIDAQTNESGNGFYTRFDDDMQRAVDLGLGSFRMSVDWSRIEQ